MEANIYYIALKLLLKYYVKTEKGKRSHLWAEAIHPVSYVDIAEAGIAQTRPFFAGLANQSV